MLWQSVGEHGSRLGTQLGFAFSRVVKPRPHLSHPLKGFFEHLLSIIAESQEGVHETQARSFRVRTVFLAV